MKVIHVLNDFSHGGAEAFIFSLIEESASSCMHWGGLGLHDTSSPINNKRVKRLQQVECDVYNVRNSFFLFLRWYSINKPDVLHCHNLKALLFCVCGNILNGRKSKIVFTQHTSQLKRKLFHRILRSHVDAYIAICTQAAEDFKKAVPESKIKVVPNGVTATQRIDVVLKKESKCNIGMIARFHPIKNHAMLVDSLFLLKKMNKLDGFHFFLFGDGEERSRIEDSVISIGCADSVTFLGAVDEARKFIDGFDYLLLCSKNEGLPITILEALEKKTPVIATNVGGIPDLISDGVNGYLVDCDDHEGLANTLVEASSVEAVQKFSEYFEGHEFAFSMNKVLQQHVELYKEVLR